jgi:hypothetical protein
MEQVKRSYYLPGKLVDVFNKECIKSGYVREKVVAAAVQKFMESDPKARAAMFERLAGFLGKGK